MGNFKKHIHPLLRREKHRDKYDDSNYAVLNALDNVLNEAEQDTIKSKIQSSLDTATGEFLDRWGDWFGIYRAEGEEDGHYREHIIRHTLLPRGTIQSIIDAIKWFLNDNDANIEIYEPWRNIFYTNNSKLNGEDHLMGYYYRFAIIDITIDRPFPPEIMDIIWAFKPAGVLFYVGYDAGNDITAEWVSSPYDDLTVVNEQKLDRLTGLGIEIRGALKTTDTKGDAVTSNIFHTNRSLLNGEDVLAGAFDHGREHIHLYGTSLEPISMVDTTTLAEVKAQLLELDNVSYASLGNYDGLVDRRSTEDKYLYVIFNIRDYLGINFPKSYDKLVGGSPSVVNKSKYNSFMKNPTVSFVLRSLTSPTNPTKLKVKLKDFELNKWDTISSKDLTQVDLLANIELGNIESYVSSEGLIAIELEITNTTTAPVDIDYVGYTFTNKVATGYDINKSLLVSNISEVVTA